MIYTLKNDVLAIEYPIQFFISESYRNGEFPLWMNTWSMGFPLQSILTWSVYSTPQLLSGLILGSNVFILHIQFLLFIIAAGRFMYKFLVTHLIKDKQLGLLFAGCYL